MRILPSTLHLALVLTLAIALIMTLNGAAMPGCGPFVIDLLMGEPIPMEIMIEDFTTVRIVYIGEIHTLVRHHELQADILRLLAARDRKLAVGMEMFSERQQEILDRWQKGTDGVSGLIRELGKDHWTNLADYGSVLTLARELHAPIVGLNASDGLVRRVAQKGLEGLTESERKQVPAGVANIDPLHDRLLRMKLRVHKAFKGRSLDRIVLAQALRDETMARVVVRFLASPQGKDRVLLVIAGNGHLNYGFGIPHRVQRLMKVPFRILLPSESGELVLSEEQKRQSLPVEITHEELTFIRRSIADYLHVVPLVKEEQEPELNARQARALSRGNPPEQDRPSQRRCRPKQEEN